MREMALLLSSLLSFITWQLHVGWVIGDVHQSGVHHLVVDSVLRRATHTSSSGVEIVDVECAHPSLFDDIGSLSEYMEFQRCKRGKGLERER